MRRMGVYLSIVCMALLALPVAGEEEPGVVARIYWVKPKAGMQQAFEAASKQHMEWHRQQNDPWTWNTWVIQTGEDFGTYGIGTFGHQWSDFDNPGVSPQADSAHYLANVGQYVESVTSVFAAYLPKISRPRTAGPAPMSVVLRFRVRMGKGEEFMNAIAKVSKAIEKTNWLAHYAWYALVNGGEHPTFVLVLPQENYADMAPQEKPFEKMLEEAFGRAEAEAIRHTFDKTIKSESSYLSVSRPDLSYIPASE